MRPVCFRDIMPVCGKREGKLCLCCKKLMPLYGDDRCWTECLLYMWREGDGGQNACMSREGDGGGGHNACMWRGRGDIMPVCGEKGVDGGHNTCIWRRWVRDIMPMCGEKGVGDIMPLFGEEGWGT